MSEFVIRNYLPSDCPKVLELYGSARRESPFFTRDEQYFNYFLSYPGVQQNSIFIATYEHEIAGVAIIAINQEQQYTVGKIIELWATETVVGSALVQKAVEYCRDKDADKLEASPPVSLDSGNTFTGWQKISQRVVLMAKPLSPKLLLEALFDAADLKSIGDDRRYVFLCDNERIKLETGKTKTDIEPSEFQQESNDITVTVSSQTLLDVIFNYANPYLAFLTRRIKIRPLGSVSHALRMLQMLQLRQAWSLALVDRR